MKISVIFQRDILSYIVLLFYRSTFARLKYFKSQQRILERDAEISLGVGVESGVLIRFARLSNDKW